MWAAMPLKQVAKTNHDVNSVDLKRRKQKVDCQANTVLVT